MEVDLVPGLTFFCFKEIRGRRGAGCLVCCGIGELLLVLFCMVNRNSLIWGMVCILHGIFWCRKDEHQLCCFIASSFCHSVISWWKKTNRQAKWKQQPGSLEKMGSELECGTCNDPKKLNHWYQHPVPILLVVFSFYFFLVIAKTFPTKPISFNWLAFFLHWKHTFPVSFSFRYHHVTPPKAALCSLGLSVWALRPFARRPGQVPLWELCFASICSSTVGLLGGIASDLAGRNEWGTGKEERSG